MQWSHDGREVGHKAAVVIDHAQVRTELCDVRRGWRFSDGFERVLRWMDGLGIDALAQVFYLFVHEQAFRVFQTETGVHQASHDLVARLQVFLIVLARHLLRRQCGATVSTSIGSSFPCQDVAP